jgi:hypothetical protein
MVFGRHDIFAIEVGAPELYQDSPVPFVQFRFWIGNIQVGDWDDRISLLASIENACTTCDTEHARRRSAFAQVSAAEAFRATYDSFYSYDYTTNPVLIPNLRDQFHLDEIGMSAIHDKFGLILIASPGGFARIIAKDLRQELIIADVSMPQGFAEAVLCQYIQWGRSQLEAARG